MMKKNNIIKYILLALALTLVVSTSVIVATSFISFGSDTSKTPTFEVTTDEIEIDENRIAQIHINIKDNPGVAYVRFGLEVDSSLTQTGSHIGEIFEEHSSKAYYIFNTLYGENSYDNGTILSLYYSYPEESTVGTEYPIKLTVLECYDTDLNDISVKIVNGGVKVIDHPVYKQVSDTPIYEYPEDHSLYGAGEFTATTAAKLPSGKTIVIDGKAESVWQYTEKEELALGNTNEIEAYYRTIWETKNGHDYLNFLVNVHKNGSVITESDAVQIMFSFADNVFDEFGGGGYEIASTGELTRHYGWYYDNYASRIPTLGVESAATLIDENTYQIELRLRIPESNNESDNYLPKLDGAVFACNVTVKDGSNSANNVGWTYEKFVTGLEYFGKVILGDTLENSVIHGDVNGDGKIKGNDSTLLLKYLAGWNVTVNEANADVNGDGKIKGNDSTLLLKYLAGWDVKLGK